MKSNDSVTTNTSNEKGSLSMDEILQREMEDSKIAYDSPAVITSDELKTSEENSVEIADATQENTVHTVDENNAHDKNIAYATHEDIGHTNIQTIAETHQENEISMKNMKDIYEEQNDVSENNSFDVNPDLVHMNFVDEQSEDDLSNHEHKDDENKHENEVQSTME